MMEMDEMHYEDFNGSAFEDEVYEPLNAMDAPSLEKAARDLMKQALHAYDRGDMEGMSYFLHHSDLAADRAELCR